MSLPPGDLLGRLPTVVLDRRTHHHRVGSSGTDLGERPRLLDPRSVHQTTTRDARALAVSRYGVGAALQEQHDESQYGVSLIIIIKINNRCDSLCNYLGCHNFLMDSMQHYENF